MDAKKLKVLHLGKFYPPDCGGIESAMEGYVAGLNRYGIKCDVLCAKLSNRIYNDSALPYSVFRAHTLAVVASTAISPMMICKLWKLRKSYDIIHVHFPDPMALLALFIVRPKARILINWHSDIIRQKRALKFIKPLILWAIKRASCILGATEAHINESDFSATFKDKGRVLPYTINPSRFLKNSNAQGADSLTKSTQESKTIDTQKLHRRDTQESTAQSQIVRILAIGRLVYYKGFEFLIDSMEFLDERFRLTIIGEGALRDMLKKRISKQKNAKNIQLLGEKDSEFIARAYDECDIFCLPSIFRSEMFGIVQIEAMQRAKPVVSTRIPRSGIKHVNIHNKSGFTVPPKDAESLASAFLKLANNSVLYDNLAKGAKDEAQKYEESAIIPRLITLYDEIVPSQS